MKPLLSILIPVAPNRESRLRAILSRLSLNSIRFPDHTFEVVVVDGGSTDNTESLCVEFAKHLNLKYIYVPINRYICASYPRNVGLRVCEGKVVGMVDVDHFISENIVFGMLSPFVDDSEFRFNLGDRQGKIKDWKNQEVLDNVINRGYVIDSSKSRMCVNKQMLEKFNDIVLGEDGWGFEIMDAYKQALIPPPGKNNTLWTWSVQRKNILKLNGYDEVYCRRFAYSSEDDDFRQRLLTLGLPFFDGQNQHFCAIHLWHENGNWRADNDLNRINKEYYKKVCGPGIQTVEGAKAFCKFPNGHPDWEWGKLLQYSFSYINQVQREADEHEEWIAYNNNDFPHYNGTWDSAEDFVAEIETYYNEKIYPKL